MTSETTDDRWVAAAAACLESLLELGMPYADAVTMTHHLVHAAIATGGDASPIELEVAHPDDFTPEQTRPAVLAMLDVLATR